MTEAQLMTELAESCRRLARYQRNPNVLDMLHDLEEDFIQEAGKRETETSGRKSSLLLSPAYIWFRTSGQGRQLVTVSR
jgi:hypothetical protein